MNLNIFAFVCVVFENLKEHFAHRAYDQFVNAHVQVYDQWASPFSISIMHAHLERKKKKKHVLCICRAGFRLPKIFFFCPGPAGFNYEKFLWVNTLPVGYS
jgi:hypothetical protein